MRSRDVEYAADEMRRKITVATARGGTTASATSPSAGSVTSSAAAMPTTVSTLTTAVEAPVWMKEDSASTSVVIRVMMRPDSSRS